MREMKHGTVVLVASLLSHIVFAQTRERPIAQLSFDAAQIDVTATPTAVRVIVIRRPDRVPIYLTQAEAAAWADSAERLLSASVSKPPQGEIVRYEAISRERTPSFALTRELRGRASTLGLYFTDEYVVNTVLAAVDTSQARTFIEAVRRAAIVSGEMDKGESIKAAQRRAEPTSQQSLGGNIVSPSGATDQRTYFAFQVQKPAEISRNSPLPEYPPGLESSGVGGEVQAQFVVTRAGTADMDSFKVLKSTNELFTQAVRSILPRMRFSPGMIGGKPINQLVRQSFQFVPPR